MSTKNRKIWAAGVLLILTVAAAIGFLFRLSQPDQEQRSVYLNCTESDRGGWVFFTEAGPVEPVFGFGGYINGIPAEGTGPVAAERVMEEPGARHFLQFDSYGAGLQVFLDHTLLYTDFPAEENPVDSFLEDVDPASISHDGLRVPLPEDCGGKRLRIVTYGPSGDGLRQPVLPSLVGRFSDAVVQTSGVVWPMAAVTAQLLLAICLLLVLLLGAHDGEFLWKLLPLIGYSLLAAAAVGGFAITAVAGKFMIPALHRLHFGQTIREEGPTWHSKKNGTPTMGGLCFILGILATLGIVWVMYSPKLPEVLGMPQLQAGMLVLFLAFGSGLIGFLDDFIKVVKHRNLGLTEAQKMILQIALTFGFMFGLHSLGLLTTQVQFPIFGLVDMGLLYYPIAFFGIIFLVNAVNLTDGLDGLCTGVTFVSMIGYLLAGSLLGFVHVSLIAAATAGACAGFLVWNFYPAKVFMGDTGSMFFGGIVTALAFVMQRPELVLFFGIVYIWDAMTVVIQRTYFKATHGKRIFRMTPIHHAFEMRGWREVKIDGFFALIAVIGVAMGIFYICVA